MAQLIALAGTAGHPGGMTRLLPEFFRRIDERPDRLFYQRLRDSQHLDAAASEKARELYRELLVPGGEVLDLMAGRESHLPPGFSRVVGLGLNASELAENPRITEVVVHDLNQCGQLPFGDGEFDGAVCTVSVQYMTRPTDTFAEVARSLRPGAPFIVTFSARMFPSKAVLAWRSSDDAAHLRLVASYFNRTAGFGPIRQRLFVPSEGDPLYAVWAYRVRRAVHA